jgi:hypothetical protein
VKASAKDIAEHWNRGCLDEWRARHSDMRRQDDAKLLSRMFNIAAKVPQAKEALDWARGHGIEFIVDRTTTRANGYYGLHAGVVAVTADALKDPAQAVETLTHEIRHAWQDWHGLLNRKPGRFAEFFPVVALTEADADAFGKRAARQYYQVKKYESWARWKRVLPLKRYLGKLEKQISDSQKDPENLWKGFLNWFHRGRGFTYGSRTMEWLAKELGVPGATLSPNGHEFYAFADRDAPERDAPDYRQDEVRLRLGRGFSGRRNYFNTKAHRRTLEGVLDPENCERFYSDRKRPKLMDDIRKCAARLKLQKQKMKAAAA